MAKVQVQIGSAARKELFFALDSTSTTGAGKTGASGTMSAYYVRNDTTPTATSITSPAFAEVSSANMPGVYYLTVPVGAFASGATTCVVMITGTGMAPVAMEYQLVGYDPTDGVRLGLTALPNVAQGSAGALITSGTGTAQLSVASGAVTVGTMNSSTISSGTFSANALDAVWGTTSRTITGGTIGTVSSGAVTASSFAANALDAVWGTTARTITGGTIGTVSSGAITASSFAANALDAVWGTTARTITGGTIGTVSSGAITSGSFAANALDAVWGTTTRTITGGTVASVTGNVTGSVNSVATGVTLASGAITSSAITTGVIGDDVWSRAVSSYTTNTTMGYRILRSDSTSHSGDVYVQGNGTANNHNRIDSDTHSIDGDHAAATNLKNALTGIAGTVITATLTALDSAERNAIADAILNRSIAGGSSAGRLVKDALRALRNKVSISGTTLTVTAEDDTTTAWTATVSTDAAATPVTGIDPA